jgi:hypothetical protein
VGKPAKGESDPVATFAPDGSVIATTLRTDAAGTVILYASHDGGATFGPGQAGPEMFDKEWVAADPAGTYRYLTGAQGFSRSVDDGATWSAPAAVGCCWLATVAVGQGGTVTIAGEGFGDVPDPVQFIRSTDHGATWSAPKTVADKSFETGTNLLNGRLFRAANSVYRAAAPASDALFLVWGSHPNSTAQQACADVAGLDPGDLNGACESIPDSDVYFARSLDGGATWSAPFRINEDATDLAFQFLPQVAVSPNGRDVHVAWLDQRADPTGLFAQAYYRHSPDAGATWDPEILVSDAPFLTALSHHQGGAPFVGDYLGLQASNDRAVIGFPDTRYGRADAFVATIT